MGNLTRDVVKSVGYSNSNKHRRKEGKGHKRDMEGQEDKCREGKEHKEQKHGWGEVRW